MFKRKICPHCSNREVNHWDHKIDEIILAFLGLILISRRFRQFTFWLGELIINFAYRVGIYAKIISIDYNYDRRQIRNRSLVLLDEADKHGIKIYPLKNKKGRYNHCFYGEHHQKSFVFDTLPTNLNQKMVDFFLIDDKYLLKKFLIKNDFPYAQGKYFFRASSGYQYGLKLGFPLVVKPRYGSLSCHVSVNINSEEQLRQAIKIVKKYQFSYLVEKYITGDIFRVSVINNHILAANRRPATIIGDGIKTIQELINDKNNHPYRGEEKHKNITLHKIIVDNQLIERLNKESLSLSSIPAVGQLIILNEKVNLGSGCDIEEATDKIHAKNKELCLKVARALKTDILGIDFICRDIAVPYDEQPSAIIECNSLPYIDMHHFPSAGGPRNAAKHIVELIKQKLS